MGLGSTTEAEGLAKQKHGDFLLGKGRGDGCAGVQAQRGGWGLMPDSMGADKSGEGISSEFFQFSVKGEERSSADSSE